MYDTMYTRHHLTQINHSVLYATWYPGPDEKQICWHQLYAGESRIVIFSKMVIIDSGKKLLFSLPRCSLLGVETAWHMKALRPY